MEEISTLKSSLYFKNPPPFSLDFNNIFIGRDSELTKLENTLKKTIQGNGKFIVITGEAGTGKSTLLKQFSQKAQDQGVRVLHTVFEENSAYRPYQPFLKFLKILDFKLEGWDDSSPDNNLIPAGSWDTKTFQNLQKEQNLIQQKIISALLEASQKNPLLLTLEFMHTAPVTSWQFLHYLTKSLVEFPILVVTTLRQDGKNTEKKPPYSDVLQRMNREGLVERIKLERLDFDTFRHFLIRVFKKADFSSHFIPTLFEISGGLPSLLIKLLNGMNRQGLIYQLNSIWFDKEEVNKETLLQILREEGDYYASPEKMENLTDIQRQILKYAVLFEGCFDHQIISGVTGLSRIIVIKELEQLTGLKIIHTVEDSCYQIKRPIIRSIILEKLSDREKKALHLSIAKTLQKFENPESPERLYQLAWHFNKSDECLAAFQYLCRAGDLALRNFAFPEARNFYYQALDRIATIKDKVEPPEIIQLYIKTAWLDRMMGQWRDGIKKCQWILRNYNSRLSGRERNQVLIQMGLTYFRLSEWERAREYLERCLQSAGTDQLYEQAMANYGLGNVYLELANYEISRNYYLESLKFAKELNIQHLIGNILNNLGIIHNVLGHRLKAIAFYSKCIPIFQSIGDNLGLAQIYNNIGMTYADENSWDKANEFYGKSLWVSDRMGFIHLKSVAFLNRALAMVHLKQIALAQEYNFKAFRLVKNLRDQMGLAEYHKIQGMIEKELGNWEISANHLSLAYKKFKQLNNRLGLAETEYEKAELALELEDDEAAREWFMLALDCYRKLGIEDKTMQIQIKLQILNKKKL